MLINNITKLKGYIPTIAGSEISRYSTYLQTAEEYLITELIGDTLFAKLSITTPDAKLLRYCENIICHKAYLDAIPFLDLVETETGFAVVSDVNNSVVPASKDRVEKLIRGTETRLSDAIEQLLEYLEGNEDFYNDWKGAKAYSINHESYIFTLTQFRRYARYDASRIEWMKDISKVTRALRNHIEPYISAALSQQIIAQLKDNTLSNANKLIIEDLRFALAAFVTGDKATGNEFVFRVKQYLIDNVDNYAPFKTSSIYEAYLAEVSGFSTDQSIAAFGW